MKVLDIHRFGMYSLWQKVFEPASDAVYNLVIRRERAGLVSTTIQEWSSAINWEMENDCRASN